ncbi:hypothetical protein SYNPS1DRAFT_25946 [Syncephalis pseudoplumigaleata]|uniref:Uncharacterized protein n=1 Tax=Syncephalis pseudoplumigaleata TaxID=1712513 RepID=A0A4P9YU26_9FUNG|nr:hypothetical protein SYNPS1DRAFT_25946 [Syncephalis pseudoplumigaleata]|eukprot:RKP22350.1 hypothetical protein SYNPS1DRAFT_25946 [Syncephalis pseudoplumigaleata]
MLKAEVNGARIKISELEKDLITLHNQAGTYRKELIELRRRSGLPVDDLVADESTTTIIVIVIVIVIKWHA